MLRRLSGSSVADAGGVGGVVSISEYSCCQTPQLASSEDDPSSPSLHGEGSLERRQKAQLLSQRRRGYLRQRARPGTLGGRHVPPLSTLEVARTGLPSWSGPGGRRPEPARGSAKRLLGLSLCPSSSPGCEPLHRPGGSQDTPVGRRRPGAHFCPMTG